MYAVFWALHTRHTCKHAYANNTPHYTNSTMIYCVRNTISVSEHLGIFHHTSHKSPYSPLLVAADGRRRRAEAAPEGEKQDSCHQVPPEEERAYRQLGAGGLGTTRRGTKRWNPCLSRWRTYLRSCWNGCRYSGRAVPLMDRGCPVRKVDSRVHVPRCWQCSSHCD